MADMKKLLKKLIFYHSILLLILVPVNKVFSVTSYTMYVDSSQGNNAPYDTIADAATAIQTAINYISTLPGDDLVAVNARVVILIRNGSTGTYSQTAVTIAGHTTSPSNNIILQNYPGHFPEILDSNANSPGVALTSPWTLLKGVRCNGNNPGGVETMINPSANTRIRDCEIYNCSDAIRSGASATNIVINNNIFHHNSIGPRMRSEGPVIYSNISYSNNRGMQLGTTGGNALVYQNIVYDNSITGMFINEVYSSMIYNNLIYNNAEGITILGSGDCSDNQVFNNTLYNNTNGIFLNANGSSVKQMSIYNNIIVNGAN